jgi:hypothetical protein
VGIQTLVVFAGIAIALAVGTIAASWGTSLRMIGWISIGLIPATWLAVRLIERSLGRPIWRYSAPYGDSRITTPPMTSTDAEPDHV